MSWYKKSMALDPDAWQYEENPARLQKDLDEVKLPWGTKIKQPQNITDIKNKYRGVHLTNSDNIAAIYANGKATKDDPPVLIEIDPIELKRHLDVDAQVDYALEGYIDGRKREWVELLQDNDPEVISETFRDNLDSDSSYWESSGDIQDMDDIIAEQDRPIPPQVIANYIGDKNDVQTVQILRDLVSGKIPPELHMSIVNQFRVLNPITLDRIKGIYQIPFVNMSEEYNRDYLDDLSPEELEKKGITKGEDEYYDKEGRMLLSYEDIDYNGWLSFTPIYQNQQTYFEGMSSEESVWHGTTLSRVKMAFPELFRS